MQHAARLAAEAVASGRGGPFGAVVVRDTAIIGEGSNAVIATRDPTAHAEIVAIRAACRHLDTFTLTGCTLVTSCEPCPMCLGAILWARLDRVYYACTRADAAAAGFDDATFYEELLRRPESRRVPCLPFPSAEADAALAAWRQKADKVPY